MLCHAVQADMCGKPLGRAGKIFMRLSFLTAVCSALCCCKHVQADLCGKRLGRAGKLTNLLGDDLVLTI